MSEPDQSESQAGKGPSMKAKLQIVGGIAVLVLVECVVAFMVIPSPQDVIRAAENQAVVEQGDGETQTQEVVVLAPDEELIEVQLLNKPFAISAYRPLSDSQMRIDFELCATIRESDRAEFEALLAKHEKRFQEQVNVIVRSSDENDLTDASLGLLKRKILEKTNNILGKPMVHSIIFSEYSFIEQ